MNALWMNYPMNFESDPSRFTTWKNGGYPGISFLTDSQLGDFDASHTGEGFLETT
jgi:hypothetical protein